MSVFQQIADEVRQYLISHDLWRDTRIYFDGMCYDSSTEVIHGVKSTDYFEYGNDETLSMSYEGPLYREMNEFYASPVFNAIEAIFKKYGYYSEFGHSWNLSIYPV